MTPREEKVLAVAQAIAAVGRALAALNSFPPSEHAQFSALLSCPATAEEFCLPRPSDAALVISKNLRHISRDFPTLESEINALIVNLNNPTP